MRESACFALFVGLRLAVFWTPLSVLMVFAFEQEQFSHIILLPLVSGALVFLEAKRIFAHVETRLGIGSALLFGGAVLYWLGQRYFASSSENDQLAVAILAVVVVWIGGFVFCYGGQAFRRGLFPVLVLVLMVPIPDAVAAAAIAARAADQHSRG